MKQLNPNLEKSRLRPRYITLVAVPLLVALIGLTYTLFEYFGHLDEVNRRWHFLLGVGVLGLFGPLLSWLILLQALRAARTQLSSEVQLARRNSELSTLNRIALEASQSIRLDERIKAILDQTLTAIDADAGMIFLKNGTDNSMRLQAFQGVSVDAAYKEMSLTPGYCLCGQAVKSREILFAEDFDTDIRCVSSLCLCSDFCAIICIPLDFKGQITGLLQFASRQHGHFTEDRRDFMAAVARQVSISIENARLYQAIRDFSLELEEKINHRTRELEIARYALAEKARQLQQLLNDSYRVQEDTRMRIAHDMHDGVTQIIIGALYEIQAGRETLAEDIDTASLYLAHAQELLQEAEVEIRRVIYDLHPPVLDVMGLVVAVKRFAANYSQVFDLACEIRVTGESRRLPDQTEIALYRIIQAALHNTATHARAQTASVHFIFQPDQFQLVIGDDGVGFDPKKAMSTPGQKLGLISMQERAHGLGALLAVESAAGKGTQIEVCLSAPQYLAEDALQEN